MNQLELAPEPTYVFRLYVSGSTPRSTHAIAHAKRMLDHLWPGDYKLEVVDLYQCRDAVEQGIVATPTLLRLKPTPSVRLIGDAIANGLH